MKITKQKKRINFRPEKYRSLQIKHTTVFLKSPTDTAETEIKIMF